MLESSSGSGEHDKLITSDWTKTAVNPVVIHFRFSRPTPESVHPRVTT
jgi:hypothetical protein